MFTDLVFGCTWPVRQRLRPSTLRQRPLGIRGVDSDASLASDDGGEGDGSVLKIVALVGRLQKKNVMCLAGSRAHRLSGRECSPSARRCPTLIAGLCKRCSADWPRLRRRPDHPPTAIANQLLGRARPDLNKQGLDVGTQYRWAIFPESRQCSVYSPGVLEDVLHSPSLIRRGDAYAPRMTRNRPESTGCGRK